VVWKTRIAVGVAVSRAGYLLALSNLCGTAHLPLFAGFGRVKDIRPGDLSAPFSDIASRCSADFAVTIYREDSAIVWSMYPGTWWLRDSSLDVTSWRLANDQAD
jgi:hypothetical protein